MTQSPLYLQYRPLETTTDFKKKNVYWKLGVVLAAFTEDWLAS